MMNNEQTQMQATVHYGSSSGLGQFGSVLVVAWPRLALFIQRTAVHLVLAGARPIDRSAVLHLGSY